MVEKTKQSMSPQRCARPNAQACEDVAFHVEEALQWDEAKDSEMGDNPELSGGPNVITCPYKIHREG